VLTLRRVQSPPRRPLQHRLHRRFGAAGYVVTWAAILAAGAEAARDRNIYLAVFLFMAALGLTVASTPAERTTALSGNGHYPPAVPGGKYHFADPDLPTDQTPVQGIPIRKKEDVPA
jgi:hypothetical protein